MFLNDTQLSCFGARLLDYTVGAPGITNETFQGKNAQFPKLLASSVAARPLTVSLVFFGKSRNDVTRRISRFLAEAQGTCQLYLPDGFFYTSILQGVSDPQPIIPTQVQVDFQFLSVRHGAMIRIPLEKSGEIYCDGNLEADCIFSLTAQGTASVQGVTVKNISGTVVIDGIQKTITQNGANKFADADLLTFPKLTPGKNVITLSAGAKVTIQYYPVYF